MYLILTKLYLQVKRIKILLLLIAGSGTTWSQTNTFPETGNVTIGSGNLYQTGSYNLYTQGAINLKNYLLFDCDGDWTGGNYFTIQDDASGDFLRIGRGFNNNLIIGSNGYIGIGTSTPDFKLDINGSLRLGKDDKTGLNISKFTSALTDVPGSTSGILFKGPIYSHVVFDLQGNDSDDGFYVRVPSVLQANPSVDRTAFSIKANGKIGIGTSSPSFNLDIIGNSNSTTIARINSGGHANYRLSRGNSSYDGGYFFYTGSLLDWRFQENANSSDLNIKDESLNENVLTIQDNTGNIGIGTTTPDFKLDINGSLRLGKDDKTGLNISKFTSALTDVPGSTSGILFKGPLYSHVVFDVQGNDSDDGFYIRVPDKFQVNPTVNTTAFVVKANGKVGIGTTSPKSKLAVDGEIRANEVKVLADISVPDYVFAPNYKLRTLKETQEYITTNRHLPEIPSASEIKKNGIDLGDMNMRLLEKIEELTLYTIDQQKQIEVLKQQNKEIERLKEIIERNGLK